MIKIALIVEGYGEVEAVPALLHRIFDHISPELRPMVARPIRRLKSKLLAEGELEKDIEFAAELVEGEGCVFVVLDSDDDCIAELGRTVADRARAARPDVRTFAIVAAREYECWLIASGDSLKEAGLLPAETVAPEDPESIRGGKEWLKRSLKAGRYSEAVDQLLLTKKIDVNLAMRAKSFARLYRICSEIVRDQGGV